MMAVLILLGVLLGIAALMVMTVYRENCVKCNSYFNVTTYDQSEFPYTHTQTRCLSCGHKTVKLDRVKEIILMAREAFKKRENQDRGSADNKS